MEENFQSPETVCARKIHRESFELSQTSVEQFDPNFSSNKGGFECHICNAGFGVKVDYRNHMKNCHAYKERPFTCETCFKMFPTTYHLNRHLKMHSDLREFQCEHCGKRFKHNYHVKNHRCYQIQKNY